MSELLRPLTLGRRTARNRTLFGPHVTNLGDDDRRFTDRHLAYYRRRAAGGCGTVVLEEASVHPSDWPYERCPWPSGCGDSWTRIGGALHGEGALAIAALGHSGGQGSSAYSQRELWAPSRVPEVNSREVPKWMEPADIEAVVDGFASAAALAVSCGLDGVEVNAGQHSLLRQFLSGLTNHRSDAWGADRLLLVRTVLAARPGRRGRGSSPRPAALVRRTGSVGRHHPRAGAGVGGVAVRRRRLPGGGAGAIFSVEKTRPDHHEPEGFNLDLCREVRAAVPERVAVVLQGSVVDPVQAMGAVAGDVCDAVEMTRAQIADPDLVAKLRAGAPSGSGRASAATRPARSVTPATPS